MRDHYIETNGVDVTHRVPNVLAWNDYDEIDWANTTWTDTTIRVLLGSRKSDEIDKVHEGYQESEEDLNVRFKSTDTVAKGDLIIHDGITYRIVQYRQRPYAGMTVKRGILKAEPMGG